MCLQPYRLKKKSEPLLHSVRSVGQGGTPALIARKHGECIDRVQRAPCSPVIVERLCVSFVRWFHFVLNAGQGRTHSVGGDALRLELSIQWLEIVESFLRCLPRMSFLAMNENPTSAEDFEDPTMIDSTVI